MVSSKLFKEDCLLFPNKINKSPASRKGTHHLESKVFLYRMKASDHLVYKRFSNLEGCKTPYERFVEKLPEEMTYERHQQFLYNPDGFYIYSNQLNSTGIKLLKKLGGTSYFYKLLRFIDGPDTNMIDDDSVFTEDFLRNTEYPLTKSLYIYVERLSNNKVETTGLKQDIEINICDNCGKVLILSSKDQNESQLDFLIRSLNRGVYYNLDTGSDNLIK